MVKACALPLTDSGVPQSPKPYTPSGPNAHLTSEVPRLPKAQRRGELPIISSLRLTRFNVIADGWANRSVPEWYLWVQLASLLPPLSTPASFIDPLKRYSWIALDHRPAPKSMVRPEGISIFYIHTASLAKDRGGQESEPDPDCMFLVGEASLIPSTTLRDILLPMRFVWSIGQRLQPACFLMVSSCKVHMKNLFAPRDIDQKKVAHYTRDNGWHKMLDHADYKARPNTQS
jgi:hypothetical protein